LGKKAKQHFFCVDPLQETAFARFSGVGHDIVFNVEDGFAEGPGDGLVKQYNLLDYPVPI
jgi:hypothetical protein